MAGDSEDTDRVCAHIVEAGAHGLYPGPGYPKSAGRPDIGRRRVWGREH